MKTTVMFEVFVDLVLEDVLNDGCLFEANPYHDAAGKFTSKDAAKAYGSGAMAKGRAAGMKARAQGLGREAIRLAIKDAMAKHAESGGGRAEGQGRLAMIRGKIEKGTIPGQKMTARKGGWTVNGGVADLQAAVDAGKKEAAPAKPTYGDLRKLAPELAVKDQALVHALLKPETDPDKRVAKAGNIERALEMHGAGQLKLPAETVASLKQAHAALTKAEKPKVDPKIQEFGAFLGKWSQGKPITKWGGTFYKSGKWMTKIEDKDVEALLTGGIATGNKNSFTVPKVKKTKEDREAEKD